MNELEFQEEWLSAYLDDELTDEQRLVVEQRLAIDPAVQATLDDLRRVRTMVAKLPSWSGANLKLAIPTGVPGSFEETDTDGTNADFEIENDSDDELEDFEQVPRLIAGDSARRVSATESDKWDSNARSMVSMFGWIATAASVLLVAGLGYMIWPSAAFQVANLDSWQAPSLSKKVDSNSKQITGLESTELNPGGNEALGAAIDFGSTIGAERQGGSGAAESSGLAHNSAAPLLADNSDPNIQFDALGRGGQEPLAFDKKEAKLETFAYPQPPHMSSGLAGGFSAEMKLSLAPDSLPTDGPAADLPPPGPSLALGGNAPRVENTMNTDAIAKKSQNQGSALTSSGVYFARSQSWLDDEAKSSLSYGTNEYSANQLAFGNIALQRGETQKEGEIEAESVLMAAIKPEVANSPVFFQDIVVSNGLVAIEQQPTLNRFSGADSQQNFNSASTTTSRDAARAVVPLIEAANSPVSNMFSNQRSQMGLPNSPQGNSFILFLNRDEASQILNQLQEKQQVSSQVWRVVRQPESQTALDKSSNVPPPAEPQNPVQEQTAGGSPNGRADSGTNAKVILMLNGPPN